MLQMGWRQTGGGGTAAVGTMLLSSFIAFGWSFITGLLMLGVYVASQGT
jgi:hypothetical protein